MAAAKPPSDLTRDPGSAEMMDEIELKIYGLLFNAIALDKREVQVSELLKVRLSDLRQLMTDRYNAYNLEFSHSNLKRPIVLNALLVIDLWPVILILSLALVAGVAFRQRAFEIIQSSIIQDSPNAKEKAIQSASTGFTVGTITTKPSAEGTVSIFRRPFILLPEQFLTICLMGAVVYMSLNIPQTQLPSRIMMSSSVFGYHTILVILSIMLSVLLARTKRYFDCQVTAVIGTRTFTPLSLAVNTITGRITKIANRPMISRVVVIVASLVALASLILPWTYPWRTHGYAFLLRQIPLVPSSTLYRIDPGVFLEMRLQLAVVIAFLCVAITRQLVIKFRHSATYAVILRGYGLLVLALIANMMTFFAFMYYWRDRETFRAVTEMIFGNGTLLEAPRGMPLLAQVPMYGFYLFLASLFTVCLFAVVRSEKAARGLAQG